MNKRSRRGASASQADADGNGPCDTTAAAIDAALAEQKRSFEMLLDVQLKAFQACVTTMMDSTNTRIDTFVKVMPRELTELKTSVQFSQTELHEMRNNYKTENDKERYDHRSLQKLTADFRRMDDTIDYLGTNPGGIISELTASRSVPRRRGPTRSRRYARYSRRISRCRLTTSKRSPSNVPTAPEGHRTPTVTERWSSNSRTSKRETPCYRPLELIGLAAYSSTRTSLCESSVGEKS